MSLAGFEVTRFIAFASGKSRVTPNIFMISPARAPAALIVSRARTSASAPVRTSRTRMPAMRPSGALASAGAALCLRSCGGGGILFQRRERFRVVDENGAARVAAFGEGDGEAVGVDDLVVAPICTHG